jgi:hypothetical protein
MKPLFVNPRLLSTWCCQYAGCALVALLCSGCGSGPVPGRVSTAESEPNAKTSSGATPSTAQAKADSTVAAKSVFHLGPEAGRDPFFPDSRRRVAKAANDSPVLRLPPVNYLKLVGIWSGKSRPLALINKTPLGVGEEGNVSIVISNQVGKTELQKINVRCLEIRHDSVLINIIGEPGAKELRLAQSK